MQEVLELKNTINNLCNSKNNLATSPLASAPPTMPKATASGRPAQDLMKIHHLLRASEEELKNLSGSNEAMLAELTVLPTRLDIIKLIMTKKAVERARTAELEKKDQVIKVRDETVKELNTVIQANTIRAT